MVIQCTTWCISFSWELFESSIRYYHLWCKRNYSKYPVYSSNSINSTLNKPLMNNQCHPSSHLFTLPNLTHSFLYVAIILTFGERDWTRWMCFSIHFCCTSPSSFYAEFHRPLDVKQRGPLIFGLKNEENKMEVVCLAQRKYLEFWMNGIYAQRSFGYVFLKIRL